MGRGPTRKPRVLQAWALVRCSASGSCGFSVGILRRGCLEPGSKFGFGYRGDVNDASPDA